MLLRLRAPTIIFDKDKTAFRGKVSVNLFPLITEDVLNK